MNFQIETTPTVLDWLVFAGLILAGLWLYPRWATRLVVAARTGEERRSAAYLTLMGVMVTVLVPFLVLGLMS